MNKKTKTQKEIVKITANLKNQGKKIVTFNGSFDILHTGHIKSLQEARSKGDILIILLNSDKSVKSYKGPMRPIVPEKERAAALSALACVDYITVFDEINPISILEKIKPHIHCNGSDWGKHCVEREVVERYGGKIHILKWRKGFSTTGLINKILDTCSKPSIKAVFIDRDGTINYNKQGYVHRREDFQFIPDAVKALQKLSKTDYKIIIITNQSGIGRGFYSEKDLATLHRWLLKMFKEKNIRIDRIYHCPHVPADNCFCRKPEIGMLLQTVQDYGVSLNESWVVGDDPKDIVLGRRANVKTIKLGGKMPGNLKIQPNFYAKDLQEAVKLIISQQGKNHE